MSESVEQLIARLCSENADLRVRVASLESGERVALSAKEIAAKLGVHVRTVEAWLIAGRIPSFTLPARDEGTVGQRSTRRVWSDELYRHLSSSKDGAK